MLPPSASPSGPAGPLSTAPPPPRPSGVGHDGHDGHDPTIGDHSHSTHRGAKWALAGVTAVGLAYVWAVDPNEPNLLPACAFNAMTGLDCPGCGGTRAIHSLLHGDVVRAFDHNVLVMVALLLGGVWFAWNRLAPRLGRRPLRISLGLPWALVLGVTITAFWVVRNLPWSPFSWLGAGI